MFANVNNNKRRGEVNKGLLGIVIGIIFLGGLVTFALKPTPTSNSSNTGATAPAVVEVAESVTQQTLNDQSLMAALWMERSAEYRALCHQAYNIALERVKYAVVQHKSEDLPLAIILDIDETVLDNMPVEAMYIGTEKPYSDSDFGEWVSSGQVQAMPGAVKFLKAVDRLGVEIYYVTNRAQSWAEGTIRDMTALGFPQLEFGHMLFKSEGSDKEPRFTQVKERNNVILYLGDDLNDMSIDSSNKDSDTRSTLVEQNAGKFGVEFIMLPNPFYGNWEKSLADGYYGLPVEKKNEIRHELLKIWQRDASEPLKTAAD